MLSLSLSLPLALRVVFGCNDVSLSSESEDPSTDPNDPTNTVEEIPTETETSTERPLAGDIALSKVSMFQGVESVLMKDGSKPNTLELPVIIDRPGQLRVFVDPDARFEERQLTASLTITSNDGEEVLERTKKISGPSRTADESTTFNFALEAEQIKRTTEFHLELLEVDANGPGGGTKKDAVWDSDKIGGLDTDNTDELRIVLVPVRYNADGSGRLPDTSPAQIQRYADLAMGTYPATNVVVEVADPFEWNRPISAFSSSQWSDILQEMNQLRDRANEPPNTYYYGIFEPASSIYQYCSQGCILGLSLLAYTPNDPYFRASVGVGFPGDMAAETMVHEVGHAHGRDHAPCGTTGDRNYPYDNAKIGSWGYSVVTEQQFDPDQYYDMMSYCSPYWISDYTMYNLYTRMHTVATQARTISPSPRSVMTLVDGVPRPITTLTLSPDDTSVPRAVVQLFDEEGSPAEVTTAAFFPYSHIDGGLVAFDSVLPQGWTAEVIELPEH